MNKIVIFGAILALIGIAGLMYMQVTGFGKAAGEMTAADYKSITFMLDGHPVILKDGVSEMPAAPGSSSMVTTKYFGNDAEGDINGDGLPDKAYLITQTSGGSGTFYYVVGAVKHGEGYEGTDAVLLGDRIAPQTTEVRDGKVIVNYADRKRGEPMTVRPSEGKTLVLKLNTNTMQFGIVVQNFEGESNLPR